MNDYRNVILEEAAHGGLPVAYWPMQEVNGTAAVDLMATARGTGYNGTANGGYTLGVNAGALGNSITFNGSTGYIGTGTLGNFLGNLNTTGGTFEAWIRYTTVASRLAICGAFATGTVTGFQFVVNGNNAGVLDARKLNMTIIDTAVNIDSVASHSAAIANLSDGNWHHVVCTCTATLASTTVSYYSDGVAVTTEATAIGGNPGGVGNLSVPLAVGARDIGGTRSLFFNGGLAHVAIYPYVISAERIRYHYLAGLNGINPVLRGIGV